MPVIHKLDGLIAWIRRPEWREVMTETLLRHIDKACAGADLELEELWGVLDDAAQGVIWGAAFEDLLASDLPDGRNLADEYLKRRGWKEPVATQECIAALRHSVISLCPDDDITYERHLACRVPALQPRPRLRADSLRPQRAHPLRSAGGADRRLDPRVWLDKSYSGRR